MGTKRTRPFYYDRRVNNLWGAVTDIAVFFRLIHFCLFTSGSLQGQHGHRRTGLLVKYEIKLPKYS